MFLTPDELIDLTGYQRSDAQMRVLRFMGIEHRQRPDGKVIVLRLTVEKLLGASIVNRVGKAIEPNWSAI
jgi:hypothetical protein